MSYGIKAGDIVQLKTGGPLMSVSFDVSHYDAYSGRLKSACVFECCWFTEDGILHKDSFNERTLIKVDQETK